MLDVLSGKLDAIIRKVKGRGLLKDADINAVLKEIKNSLVDADVNLKVVNSFIQSVKEKALQEKVIASISPGHQITKIVWEELTGLLGGSASKINLSPTPPTVVMMVGLQGSGKTTSATKIALLFKEKDKKVLLVAADTKRPAAIDQLRLLGESISCDTFTLEGELDPVTVCTNALLTAREKQYDIIILDTAGRMHLDSDLMNELKQIKSLVLPYETILVADGMTGQDAVKIAESFNEEIGIDSVILTKMDGDTRGGALLSIKTVIQKPVKYIGVGEKLDALELFHPDRVASSILGMGDVASLVEKVERAYAGYDINQATTKISTDNFTFEDFKEQLVQMKKMGPIEDILKMLPGMGKMKGMLQGGAPQKEIGRTEAIINSMNKQERRNHNLINASRRRRIAQGSGTAVSDVNRLLKQFLQTRKMMKKMGKMGGLPGLNDLSSLTMGKQKRFGKWF